jgi:hypothetical protein
MKTTEIETAEGKYLLMNKTSGRVVGVTYVGLPENLGLPVHTHLAENQTELALYHILLARLCDESEFFVSASVPDADAPVVCWVGFTEGFFEGTYPVFCHYAKDQGRWNETQIRRLTLDRCMEGGSDGSTSV